MHVYDTTSANAETREFFISFIHKVAAKSPALIAERYENSAGYDWYPIRRDASTKYNPVSAKLGIYNAVLSSRFICGSNGMLSFRMQIGKVS